MYSYDERLQKIYAFNLSYLLLAQNLIQQDSTTAGFYLGIDNELIKLLKTLPLPEILRMASVDHVICQLRFDNESIMDVLTRNSRLEALQSIHGGIILSTGLLRERQRQTTPGVSSKAASHVNTARICGTA
ncbi:flagellar transcriptional regulator FlhD [Pantoea vagans]|uniref:flagellar transcriptional regulator FlhD n=1 Tax=Pantoea vagans TaxID=470934 RepID=UPI003FA3D547